MKNIKHLTLAVVSLCAATIAFNSCEREDRLLPKGLDGSKYVYLSAGVDDALATKAASPVVCSETIDLSEDGLPFFIDAQVSVNTSNPFEPQIATKGKVLTADDIAGRNYFVHMYGTDIDVLGITGSINGISNVENNRYWSLYYFEGENTGSKVEWPEAAEDGTKVYNFVAYLGNDENVQYNKDTTTFSYTGPDTYAKMKDVLVAGNQETHDHKNQWTENDFVSLRFYHALAAVRFKFDLGENVSVQSVSIRNLVKDGTFTVDPTIPNSKEDKFKTFFTWTTGSDKVDYTVSSYSAAGSVIDSSTGQVGTTVKADDAEDPTFTADNAVLFIVPQDLADVVLTFNILKGDKSYQITTKAENLGVTTTAANGTKSMAWQAGYMYTYTISTDNNGNVGIEVNDDFADNTKTVVIKNTKRSTVWIRAAIVGNWCYVKTDSDGNNVIRVMESWDGTGLSIGDKWTQGSDGYYYYSDPVLGFESADALISEWQQELKNRTKVVGADEVTRKGGVKCQLVVRIAAQAIEKTSEDSCQVAPWPEVSSSN